MLQLVCPTDRRPLIRDGDALACDHQHRFSIDPYSGAPRLYDIDYGEPFHANSWDPLGRRPDDYPTLHGDQVDDYVQSQVAATGGALYQDATLTTYPIPTFPLDRPHGTVVDVGAGWGRWSIAAARARWQVASVDPWLENCQAFSRISKQLDIDDRVQIVNGDGRRLPFPDDSAQAGFSYSVLQHLPKDQARDAFAELVRVVEPGGRVLVQMPNVAGIRQRRLARDGVVADEGFLVRPWTYDELAELAASLTSRWSLRPDGFLSLNAQWSERYAMRRRARAVVAVSEVAKLASRAVRTLERYADSVWVSLVVD